MQLRFAIAYERKGRMMPQAGGDVIEVNLVVTFVLMIVQSESRLQCWLCWTVVSQ